MILQKFVLRGGVAMERGLHFVQLHLKRSGWQLIYNDGMDICNISRNNTFFVMSTIFQYVPICSSTAWPVQSNSKKARGSTSSWTCSNSRLQSSQRWVWMIILVWWYCEGWLWEDDQVDEDDHIGLMISRRVIMKRWSAGWRVDPAGWSCDHGWIRLHRGTTSQYHTQGKMTYTLGQ